MGKKNSWLKTMKNAFKSSSASSSRDSSDKRVEWSSSQRDDEYEEEGYENMMPEIVSVEHFPSMDGDCEEEDEYASVVEMAAEAAAEAAKKAVRLMRMAKYGRRPSREEMAAVVVQSCFRGYLARRARRALRALVRLQAIIRGCTVRKQAQLTMQCMQSLVRVQARARATRLNLLTCTNPNKNIHTIKQCYNGNNDLYTISDYNEIDDESGRYNVSSKSPASMCCRNLPESMLDREKELAYAFSCQERPQLGWNWLERRMSTDQELLRSLPDSSYTSKTNNVLDNLSEKTVEIDSDLTKYTPKIHFPPQHDDDDDQEGQRMKRTQVIPSYMVATQSAKAKVRGNYSRFDVQRRVQNRRHSGYSPDSSCGDRTPPFRGRLGKNES